MKYEYEQQNMAQTRGSTRGDQRANIAAGRYWLEYQRHFGRVVEHENYREEQMNNDYYEHGMVQGAFVDKNHPPLIPYRAR